MLLPNLKEVANNLFSLISNQSEDVFAAHHIRCLCCFPVGDQDLRQVLRKTMFTIVGHGGALVESIGFNRRVVGSTPAIATM